MLLAALDPVVLAGVFKALGWVVLVLLVVAAFVVGLAIGGLEKLTSFPFRVFRRGGREKGE